MRWFKVAFKRFNQFSGRATRPEYWYFILIAGLIFLGLFISDVALGTFSDKAGLGVLSGIWILILILPSLSVCTRRLHDTNRTGWWQLINFLPYIGWLILIALLALKGTEGENRYGSPPGDA